jgi:penicillin-binding protein 1A
VVTTIDSRLQQAASAALRTSLLEYDRRHGYRGALARDQLGDEIDESRPGRTHAGVEPAADAVSRLSDLHLAVVLNVNDTDNSASVFVRDQGYATVAWDGLQWGRYVNDNVLGEPPKKATDIVKRGDVVHLLYSAERGWLLGQLPEAQGAFVAMDPHDGAIVALTGGFDFAASKFNRAVQTRRQPGSSFKPFIYSAALENGFTPATLVNDAPVVFDDENLEETWRPENYSRRFNGPTRLREALVRSLNLVSVRVLLGTGIGNAVSHISAFGLPASALPRDSSLALGSGGASPLDLASGYAAFASGGFRTERYLIERVVDAQGNVVSSADPMVACADCESGRSQLALRAVRQFVGDEPADDAEIAILPDVPAVAVDDEVPDYDNVDEMIQQGLTWRPTLAEAPRFVTGYTHAAPRVISAGNAYLIYDMMRDVIRRGTGRRARDLGRPDIAGKTGTSNDRRDAWFSGFNGDLVATAWVGFDQERSLGAGEEGSRTALPMWKYFMAEALKHAPEATISRPSSIVTVRIDPESGLIAPSGYAGAMFEIFEDGHLPERLSEDPGPLFSGVEAGQREEESIF